MGMIRFKPMKYADEGPNVRKAQQLLRKYGSTVQVNGQFTIGMVSAVRAFQRKKGLKVTGVIDAKTMDKLKEAPAKE